MTEWYLILPDGTEEGPLSEEQAAQRIREGKVDGGSLCWTEGMKDWTPIYSVERLSIYLSSRPPSSENVGDSPWGSLRKLFDKGREGLSRSAQLAKLTLRRTQLENERHQHLAKLGELVYEKRADAFQDSSFDEIVDKIQEIDDQLAQVREEMEKVRGA